jgi:hypothetical protein
MENITATFSDWGQMETAAAMLREQGAIDVLLSSGQDPYGAAESIVPDFSNSIEQSHNGFQMQVVVESSRYRQAADTIARFGGQSGD